MKSSRKSLKDALLCAQTEDRLTVGVHQSAEIMVEDPDSVSFCVLAVDEEFECDIALQIHFTLIQSFCFDNDISIVRVSDMQRLADIVGDKAEQLEDVHCVLITVRRAESGTAGVHVAGPRAGAPVHRRLLFRPCPGDSHSFCE
uniref:Growth arrest and DNA damage inducible gamma n=1 Tax=Nothobranchius furzeri TaxID=105023 RepID=A0A8C6NKM4_NOTFU